jgi:hypothetical protein
MSAFINALKARSTSIPDKYQQAIDQKFIDAGVHINPIVETPKQEEKKELIINIDLVANRNRIDVFFSDKPDQYILDMLKANGWHHKKIPVPVWYHQDNQWNRDFLNQLLNLNIESKGMISADVEPSELTPFDIYKRQCAELIEELKIDSADLALIAIDTLHKQAFSKDS